MKVLQHRHQKEMIFLLLIDFKLISMLFCAAIHESAEILVTGMNITIGLCEHNCTLWTVTTCAHHNAGKIINRQSLASATEPPSF